MLMLCVTLDFGHCVAIGRQGLGGRLVRLWKEDVDLTILHFSKGHISALVQDWKLGGTEIIFEFYGNLNVQMRPHSSELL